ncbi:Uncharacterised protein [uncultured archaeon]|nr:Uncharacterised protein [uncultured archaeon]
MDLHSELKRRIEGEDWDYIAHMAHTFELDLEQGDAETRKLQKELQMIRRVVHAYLSSERGREKFLSTKFLIKMHKTIAKLEGRMEQNQRWRGEFLTFLHALMHKMKQEKLVVYKTLEKTREFQRHKGFGDVL